MFDEHLNRQVRLSYVARGPQWAFALPHGDLGALREVMCACSTFWNGAGSLLVAVKDDGTVSQLDAFLAVTPIDQMWLHPSLGAKARSSVLDLYPRAGDFGPDFDRRERHPLDLQPFRDPGEPRPTLMLPVFDDPWLQLIALACWGWLPKEDVPDWERSYGVLPVSGEQALRSVVDAQVGSIVTSPLAATLEGMRVTNHVNPHEYPYLFILGDDFNDLVLFWNFRSRSNVWIDGASTVGVPYETIQNPDLLSSLAAWAQPWAGMDRTPELMVVGRGEESEIDAALKAAGFDRYTAPGTKHSFGGEVIRRDRPLYGYYQPSLGGPITRGTRGAVLSAIANGKASVSLARPEPLTRRGNKILRLVVDQLPLPLPLTESLAPRLTDSGIATRDGVMKQLLDVGETWELDFSLPTRAEALACWAADQGCTTTLTQDGRYAEALLARFESLDALDVLADEDRSTLLTALASQSRLKLVQRLKRELAPDPGTASPEQLAEAIAERLKDVGIFLELEAKDAATLGGDVGDKKRALNALTPLVEAGLVVRGQSVRCPECNHPDFMRLDDMAETVQCPACRSRYVIPVVIGTGQERPMNYRLDGLMARIMDQDILPVLLALRAFRQRAAGGDLFFAWPGVEFRSIDYPDGVDVDLLISIPGVVFCCEVKKSALSLEKDQLDGLLGLAQRLGARPALAALDGAFEDDYRAAVIERGGVILERPQLLE